MRLCSLISMVNMEKYMTLKHLTSAGAAPIKFHAFVLERIPMHVFLMPFVIPVIPFLCQSMVDCPAGHGLLTNCECLFLSEDGDTFGSPAV